jgi:PAS domain S-box-containing protein
MSNREKSKEQLLIELEDARRLIAQLQGQNISGNPPPQATPKPPAPEENSRRESPTDFLQNSEQRYRSFVEQSAEGIWLIELEKPISTELAEDEQIDLFYRYSHLTECNDAMAKMYGYSNAKELLGAHLSDMLIPTDPHNIEYLRAFIRSGYRLMEAESHELDIEGNTKFFINNLLGVVENGYLVRAWGTQRDITEAKHLHEALRQNEERNRALLQAVPDWMFRYRKDGTYLDFSGQPEGLLFPPSDFLGKTLFEIHSQDLANQTFQRIEKALQTGEFQHYEYELFIQGERRYFESRMAPSEMDEVIEIVRDITESKRGQQLAKGQQKILELIAKGAPLRESLTALTRFIESLSNKSLCSILLFDEEKQSLRHGAAPSLPADYIAAIDGVIIGPQVGSCGTAAFFKESYISTDLETDPNWAAYKHLALPHGLRACWSTPILNESSKVLGTFAMYYKEPCEPSAYDYQIIEISSHLAGIAIERHRKEVELRNSEERYRALYENNPFMIFTTRLDGTILLVNEFGAQQLGYTATELVGKPGTFLFREEDLPTAAQQLESCMKNPTQVFQWEIQKIRKDGTAIWVKENVRAIKQADGSLAVLFVCEDITRRKIAESALQESEQRYKMLFERNLAGVYRGELGGRILDCNEAYANILGFASCQDALATNAVNLYFDESERQNFLKLLKEKGSLTNHEMRLRKQDGSAVWVLINGTLLEDDAGQRTQIEETLIDITERKLAEEALRESEARFRTVATSTASAMLIHRNGRLLYANPSMERISGYTQDELRQMNLRDLIHPDFIPLYVQRGEALARGEALQSSIEYKLLHKSGEQRWIDFTFGGFIQMNGKRAIIGTAHDITDRKHAEAMLIAEKERLAVTLRSIGDGVIATDTEGRIVLINRVAEKLTGWKQEEAIGKDLSEVFQIVNPSSHERKENLFTNVSKTGHAYELEGNTALMARDGSECMIANSSAPIYDKEGKIIGGVVVFRDMTEELKRDEEILKSSKLESIALLAGGIAHDFNNILTAIMGNVSLAKRFIGPGNQAYQRLNETEVATLRARDLTQQLLTFASGGAPIKKTASLDGLLQESVNFALTGSSVRAKMSLQDNLWLTDIDAGQINQVVHNLVLNARQALPLGGTIEISAENVSLEQETVIQGAHLVAGRYVKLAIKDSGVGISEEHLQKIFDPYFTTKQKGSGLGLATSYSIVKNHSGYIFVESQLGVGTSFTIYLPASDKTFVKTSAPNLTPLSGKGKILIMDDEMVLRNMLGDMLNYLGYEVETSKNGNEALEIYEKALTIGKPFDAVILDLTIPGAMGGKEATQRLHEIDPKVRCIVSSGYSNDPVMAEYEKHGFVAVIAKPYHIAQLSEVLNSVIGGSSEAN